MSTTKTKPVPAWKQIGLKLKYAQDIANHQGNAPSSIAPDESVNESVNDPFSSKRQRHDADESIVRQAKKIKSSNESSRGPPPSTDYDHHSSSSTSDISNGFAIAPTFGSQAVSASGKHHKFDFEDEPQDDKPVDTTTASKRSSRRKSVTFTSDTKAEDDDKAEQSFQSSGESTFPNQPPDNTTPGTPQSASKREKKAAKRRKAKSSGKSQQANGSATDATSSNEAREYLHYLQQYHTEKSNWKFNKKKQSHLLRDLFNIQRIPPEHDEALVAYLAGLQGAAAQQRVLEDAETVLKSLLENQGRGEDIEGMSSRAERKAAYEAALQREIDTVQAAGGGRSEYDEQQLQEIKRDVERSKRADDVLATLLANELAPPPPEPAPAAAAVTDSAQQGSQTPTPSNGNSFKITKRRKRKARTEISSDESSSDSSSESEGE